DGGRAARVSRPCRAASRIERRCGAADGDALLHRARRAGVLPRRARAGRRREGRDRARPLSGPRPARAAATVAAPRPLHRPLGGRVRRHPSDRGTFHLQGEGRAELIDAALTAVGWLDLAASIILAGGLLCGAVVVERSAAGERVLRAAAPALALALGLGAVLTALRMSEVSGVRGAALVMDLAATQWGKLWALRAVGLAAL